MRIALGCVVLAFGLTEVAQAQYVPFDDPNQPDDPSPADVNSGTDPVYNDWTGNYTAPPPDAGGYNPYSGAGFFYGYNPLVGGYNYGYGREWYNPFTGVARTATAGYNPWTGRLQENRTAYNPWTGAARTTATSVNPFTGRTVQGVNSYNPMTGNYRSSVRTYNPMTGRTFRGGVVYNPFTGARRFGGFVGGRRR